MNNPSTKKSGGRFLPFVIEFVKFSAGFATIVAIALLTLRYAGTLEAQVASVIKFW